MVLVHNKADIDFCLTQYFLLTLCRNRFSKILSFPYYLVSVCTLFMKAMILAAGFGTRLFPLTIDRTKPAIPFLGKPLVGYVAEYLAKFGITDIVVNLHHQPESVIDALGDGSAFGVHIDYALEVPNILGTAGALDNARQYLEDDTFLIANGKIITDIDISAALETHRNSGAVATMVLKPLTGRPSNTGRKLKLSGPASAGSGRATMAAKVASMSVKQMVWAEVEPALVFPGQRTMKGMRCPASQLEPFMPRNPPVES